MNFPSDYIEQMDTATSHLMRELREDHANMSVVLDLLQDCIDRALADENPDFELMDDVMHYMTIYPDAVHHPKEDAVYAELQAKRPDLATGLEDVPEDHRQIAELGTQLRDDISAVVSGAALLREKFVGDAQAYVDRLRNHMQWEEDDLFKRVDTMLAESGEDPTTDDYIRDPVFELEIASEFARLRSAIDQAFG